MTPASLFAASLLAVPLIAAPARAQDGEINPQVRVAAAVRQGCSVQHVHTPAGKLVHAAPIVRCRQTPAAPTRYASLDQDLARLGAAERPAAVSGGTASGDARGSSSRPPR